MRRFLLVLLVLGCVSAALSAQILQKPRMSAGLGGQFTTDFTSYALVKNAKYKEGNYDSHLLGGGIYTFFDFTYVEADLGLLFGSYTACRGTDYFTADVTALKLGLFGKFPFALGSGAIFPMLGIDGQVFLGGNGIDSGYGRDNLNQLWFKIGLGFDIPLPVGDGKLYLRPEALSGVRMHTAVEKENQKKIAWVSDSNVIDWGTDIRLAIGYKF